MSAYYNDNDPKICAWLRELIKWNLIAPGDVDERSICDVRAEDLDGYKQVHFFAGIGGWSCALRLAGWPDDRPVWTASCPCQPFSLGGGRQGTKDHRDLWPVFARLAAKSRSCVIFGEQVEAAIRWGWLDRLCDDMEAEGYAVGSAVLPADAVGAWHRRDRVWWVAANAAGIGGKGLEPAVNSRKAGSRWPGRKENMQAVVDGPFSPGAGWPQPLLRALDDGLSERMVGCFGAGNAIIPQVAAAFISAFMESAA